MPLIRCPKCGQAYDVPGVVAVRLPSSIATCHCGEWLSGSKAAVLARAMNPEEIREVDLQPYRISTPFVDMDESHRTRPVEAAIRPRSVRIVAKGAGQTVNSVFTLHAHPLWIGRRGCHVELAEAELSIRHCSISLRRDELVLRDADSHMGTWLDGQQIDEIVLTDGVHLLRAGSALITIEPVDEQGIAVEPIVLGDAAIDESVLAEKLRARQQAEPAASRVVLVCIEGVLQGQEFEVPPTGLVVGREGHVRVPDEFLSRRHFEVARDEDGTVRVRDLGSRNGTFLNTLPARDTRVQKGDEITAGQNRFRVEQRA